MWHGLFWGLVSLFVPQANLPDVDTIREEIRSFSTVYAIDTRRIHVRESTLQNPSPFLTNSTMKACVLHINHHTDAKRVWSHFLDVEQAGAEAAFLAFTSAHELTHCLMSEPGKRHQARQALETHLGTRFSSNTHFEETLADLVGLAYVAKVAPGFYESVFKRVKALRTDFSARDPEHDSAHAIEPENVAWVDSLLEKPEQVRLASRN